jgi:hypothetical protein
MIEEQMCRQRAQHGQMLSKIRQGIQTGIEGSRLLLAPKLDCRTFAIRSSSGAVVADGPLIRRWDGFGAGYRDQL